MIVSLRHRIAFLAMPKAASTAVEAVLAPRADIVITGDPRLKHMPFRKYARFVAPLLATYDKAPIETVCLFREPVDWLMSWYRYRQREALRERQKRTDGVDFDGFVEAYLRESPPAFARVGRPAAFVAARDGSQGVNHIYRYENFGAFAAFLSERFEAAFDFPRLNVSPPGEAPLSAPVRARAEAVMEEDFRIWREVAR
ncbi:MAG TPA: gamma-glutamyl kinase [Paracoccaceae bacterium]|nr:gamma-glutamyl kinase [Paracoccaceae bacterium]